MVTLTPIFPNPRLGCSLTRRFLPVALTLLFPGPSPCLPPSSPPRRLLSSVHEDLDRGTLASLVGCLSCSGPMLLQADFAGMTDAGITTEPSLPRPSDPVGRGGPTPWSVGTEISELLPVCCQVSRCRRAPMTPSSGRNAVR